MLVRALLTTVCLAVFVLFNVQLTVGSCKHKQYLNCTLSVHFIVLRLQSTVYRVQTVTVLQYAKAENNIQEYKIRRITEDKTVQCYRQHHRQIDSISAMCHTFPPIRCV